VVVCQSKRYYRGVADRKAPCYINTHGRMTWQERKPNRKECDMRKTHGLIVLGVIAAFIVVAGFAGQGWCADHPTAVTPKAEATKAVQPTAECTRAKKPQVEMPSDHPSVEHPKATVLKVEHPKAEHPTSEHPR